jgi:hypothetical protein
VATWIAAACQDAAAVAAASDAQAGAGTSSVGSPARGLLGAGLWLEGAACEARQLSLLCVMQQQAPGGRAVGGAGPHYLDSLAQLHAGLKHGRLGV